MARGDVLRGDPNLVAAKMIRWAERTNVRAPVKIVTKRSTHNRAAASKTESRPVEKCQPIFGKVIRLPANSGVGTAIVRRGRAGDASADQRGGGMMTRRSL